MKKTIMFSLAVLLVAGAVYAQDSDQEDSSEQVKIKGPFAETWVLPGADITMYTKLYPWKAAFQFREGGETRSTVTTAASLRGSDGPYAVSEESRQKFEKLVADTFVKELGRSKIFEVVDEVGPDTLLVRAVLLDIVSNVPPRATGMVDVHISAVGEATFLFELIDAETGQVQATVGERRRIQPPGRMHDVSAVPTNSATVWNDVKIWASSVGRDLRKALEKAHKDASKK